MKKQIANIAGNLTASCPIDAYKGSSGPQTQYNLLMSKLVPDDKYTEPYEWFGVNPVWPTPAWTSSSSIWPINTSSQAAVLWPRCGVLMQEDPGSVHGLWFQYGWDPWSDESHVASLLDASVKGNVVSYSLTPGLVEVVSFADELGKGHEVRYKAGLPTNTNYAWLNPRLKDITPTTTPKYCITPIPNTTVVKSLVLHMTQTNVLDIYWSLYEECPGVEPTTPFQEAGYVKATYVR